MIVVPKNNEVVDLFTGRGDSEGCGECCGRFLPLTILDVARLKSFLARNPIEPAPEAWMDGERLTLNFNCPFLDSERRCMVYEARPEVCRAYRCDLHRSGLLEVQSGFVGAMIVDMREVFA